MNHFCNDPAKRRGVTVVLTAVSMTLIIGFAALAIDLGYLYAIKAELQKTADAAALAGAPEAPDRRAAVEVAQKYADYNYTNQGVILAFNDALLGSWDSDNSEFYPRNAPNNALAVTVRRSEANSNPVKLFFATALGIPQANVDATAVALVGAGRCTGIWGLEGITGSGDINTDSFKSQEGLYGSGNTYANGDLCSNRDIDLEGAVNILGDTMYGPGFALNIWGNSYFISGIRRELCCTLETPGIDSDDFIANNDNGTIGLTDRGRDPFEGSPWDLVVTGNDNLTLAGGTYYFTTALIDGRAKLTIAGATTIYLSGHAEFTGTGLVNTSQDPSDLLIYSTGPTMVLSGTAGFYGAVIAPETDIQLVGTGDFYGTIVSKTIDANGTANIHVDESLVADLFGIDSLVPILVK